MTLRTLIVDDEELARRALIDLLGSRSDVTIVGQADSLQTAVAAIQFHAPDVVFLDVTLSDGDAFELFSRVNVDAQVVFLTASEAHALRAFEVNALDYLLKPTQPRHLDRAIARAKTRTLSTPSAAIPVRMTMQDTVCLREARRTTFCRVGDIVFIRSADDYTEVHLTNGCIGLVHRTLRDWATRLPDTFAQCHRSTLVNLVYLQAFEPQGRGTAQVRLHTVRAPLSVSRRFASSFKEKVAAFAH